ncbi:2-phosphoglycolate phosphatase [Thalictrum thalictroides]|uniref:2-phosphoglycolate phosphatase n=1 Tax=Thalictrum thalictroides TaxID=46969 RepID=A0A7J6VKI9_THATH|nr:2-phosphoglycolate phosphatase [Thalictrum thalictroides]
MKEEIFAFAAAVYLNSIDFPKDKKVYVVGEDGILKELQLAGIQYLGGPIICFPGLLTRCLLNFIINICIHHFVILSPDYAQSDAILQFSD